MCILLQVDMPDLKKQFIDIELHSTSFDAVLHNLSSEVTGPVECLANIDPLI
jgi:hypothetical protein